MAKKIWTVAAALAGLAAVGVGGYYALNKSQTQTGVRGSASAPNPSGGTVAGNPAASASGPARPAGVEVARVEKQSLQDDAQAVGSLRSRQNVVVRPEVSGRVLNLGFTDGERVRRGQLLVQLDDVLQRAEVKQSQAQVSIAQANHKRNQELVAQNFVAQRVLDESAANLQVANAQLSLSCARLSRMRIDAPFSGVVGIRSVSVGDYVKDGADLVNLEDIGSMFADFRLPERFQNKVKVGQTVELQLDAFPNRLFKAKIEAIDPALDPNGRSVSIRAALPNSPGEVMAPRGGGPGGPSAAVSGAAKSAAKPAAKPPQRPASGVAAAVVDAPVSAELQACRVHDRPGSQPRLAASAQPPASAVSAGTPVQAGGGPLRPGMFARATAIFGVRDNALIVPEEAIVPQGGRQFVFKVVARSDMPGTTTAALAPDVTQVSQRVEVRVGVRRPGRVEIETTGAVALAEGDTVVTAGQQRLQRDGTGLRVVELGRPGGGGGQPSIPASQAASSAVPPASAAKN